MHQCLLVCDTKVCTFSLKYVLLSCFLYSVRTKYILTWEVRTWYVLGIKSTYQVRTWGKKYALKRSSTRRYNTIPEYKVVRIGLYQVCTTSHDSRWLPQCCSGQQWAATEPRLPGKSHSTWPQRILPGLLRRKLRQFSVIVSPRCCSLDHTSILSLPLSPPISAQRAFAPNKCFRFSVSKHYLTELKAWGLLAGKSIWIIDGLIRTLTQHLNLGFGTACAPVRIMCCKCIMVLWLLMKRMNLNWYSGLQLQA